MKITAIICNVVLFGFTCLVLVTDGPPRGAGYVALTLLALLVPLGSAIVLICSFGGALARVAMMAANVALLGFACWAIISQYPHPEEEGVLAYTVLIALAPLLNFAALFRRRKAIADRHP